MASRKELITEFKELEQKHRELSHALYQKYLPIVKRYRNDKEKLMQYLDECPNCNAKLMFYQALNELDK